MSSVPSTTHFDPAAAPPGAMTAAERRASASLASLFALRMLGLFLVLPVFALEARGYPGGADAARVGLAMGIYGLTQALLQMPLGIASDQWGRKRVIVAGLAVFALGSFLAAAADSIDMLLWGRALQGAGAVSAAITALLADQTRDEVRTKAMAGVGASIGLMFALSLVAAPILVAHIGLGGLFALTGLLALGGIAITLWVVPREPVRAENHKGGLRAGWRAEWRAALRALWREPVLLRLNAGVFTLHTVQMAMWVAVPSMLVQAGLARPQHWWVYLPAVLASFVVMGGTLFPLERRGYLRAMLLAGIAAIGLVQLGLLALSVAGTPPGPVALCMLGLLMLVFFCGFNVLEASQPSLVSRLAPAPLRGAALGLYNTLQSVGLFAGGALGGLLVQRASAAALFGVSAALCAVWLAVSWRLPAFAAGQAQAQVPAP